MSPQIDLNAENNREGFFPTVSIVIPVYNGMRTIRNCLDAFLAVDYPQDRYVVFFF